MIYRIVIESGLNKPLESKDRFAGHLFFTAPADREKARAKRDAILTSLFDDVADSDAYNFDSEYELRDGSLFPEGFEDSHLVECGASYGNPKYSTEAVFFLVGSDRHRVVAAFERGLQENDKNFNQG